MLVTTDFCSYDPLKKGYTKQTITIAAPEDTNIADYDWFSVYCVFASENFGSVLIPNGLNVPPHDSEITREAFYHVDFSFRC